MKTALLLTAGILLTGATAAVVIPAINGTAAPIQQVITQLPNGNATFQHVTAETADKLTYTVTSNSSFITVTYNDGIEANYTPHHSNENQVYVWVSGQDGADATLTWNGSEATIKTENNTTVLGGFRKHYNQMMTNRQAERAMIEADQAAQAERTAELNEESFDGMVSRLSKQVCVRAEGLSYITNNTIVRQAMNPIIGDFEMSTSNSTRWNNMNPQLRSQHVLGAMSYDCNNTMIMAASNSLNTFGF